MRRTTLRLLVPAALAALAGPACGPSSDECGSCEPGFVCYFGACVPDLDAHGGDTAADADADADAPPDLTDTPETETPVDVGPDVEADEVDPPPDVPVDVPVDIPPACPDPVAHDEDGDGVDDACDLCPTIPDPEQLDDDGDGLGNACEASWDAALLSHVDAFAAFMDNRLEPTTRWLNNGGIWTPTPDVVTGNSVPYGADRWLELPAEAPYSVEARFRLRGEPLASSNYTGLLFGVRGGSTGTSATWWGCFFEWDTRTLSLWQNTGRSLDDLAWAEAVETNATPRDTVRRLRVFWDGATVGCTFDNELGGHGELTWFVDAAGAGSLSGAGGLRVYNETSAFQSFVLYR